MTYKSRVPDQNGESSMIHSRDIPLWSETLEIDNLVVALPGSRNEDSRGNENQKLRKNIFSVEKNRQVYFFL